MPTFLSPPTVDLLKRLVPNSLKQSLAKAIRLWVILQSLYGDEASNIVPDKFSYKDWEKAFFNFKLPNTRQVALRMAIVLGKTGGVIKPLKNLVRFGMGGKQGKGNQMFSWIHIDDVFNAITFIQKHIELNGVLNTAAPNPVNNKTLMQLLRKQMGVQIALPLPAWLLQIGAILIKTETELILKSRWVIPERLLNAGFQFKYATLDSALKAIIND